MKNLSLCLTWYLATIFTMVFALALFIYTSLPHQISTLTGSTYQSYKALPLNLTSNSLEINIGKGDARELIVANFFKGYYTPLSSFAREFVTTADLYHLDYRLMPAIAMQESNGGKILPANSYNPFGYGVFGKQVLRFNSFPEAISTVGKGLKENYIDQGLATPEEIMAKYTPPSLQKGGAWANGVSTFMSELR
ncbi:MAG: hypothetical protein Q7S44_01160 [bacterium]|nr:hypothetical protein [bacterium]